MVILEIEHCSVYNDLHTNYGLMAKLGFFSIVEKIIVPPRWRAKI